VTSLGHKKIPVLELVYVVGFRREKIKVSHDGAAWQVAGGRWVEMGGVMEMITRDRFMGAVLGAANQRGRSNAIVSG